MECRPHVAISRQKQNITWTPTFNSSHIARHAVIQGASHAFLPQVIEKSTNENKDKNKNKNNYNYKIV